MTRLATLAGYGVIVICAVVLEVVARRTGRVATFTQAIGMAVRRRTARLVVLTGWLWLGWHLFVRVDWR